MEATAWQRVAARIARLFFLRVNTRAATQVEGHEEHAAHVEHARAPEHVAQQQAATYLKRKLVNLLRQAPAPELAALLRRSAEPLTPTFDRLSPFFVLLELQQKYCVSAFCRLCMQRQL